MARNALEKIKKGREKGNARRKRKGEGGLIFK